MINPFVSICCLCYNHEPYLRKCLDGFVMQKTNFVFEVLIHDDASTDRSADIIHEYEAKYPEIIKPIYQTENQYSKGIGVTRVFQFPRSKGKYIAMCEGDDYWTDPYKLQMQFDYMENHNDVSMVFTNRFVKNGDVYTPFFYFNKSYNTNDVLSGLNWGVQSVCFRKDIFDFVEFNNLSKFINGDRLIPYICSKNGKIIRLKQFTAVYRITGTGVSTSRPKDKYLDIALEDFWLFHKTLGFPNKKMLAKGQARYLNSLLLKNLLLPNKYFEQLVEYISKHEKVTFEKLLTINYYIFANTVTKIVHKFYKLLFANIILKSNFQQL